MNVLQNEETMNAFGQAKSVEEALEILKANGLEMTAEELQQLKKFREEQQRKALEEKRQKDREAYNSLVDETINNAMPILQSISEGESRNVHHQHAVFQKSARTDESTHRTGGRCLHTDSRGGIPAVGGFPGQQRGNHRG